MKKIIKNEDGITLVELLASLAILTGLIILIGSFHIFGQKHFSNQIESNNQASDLRYSLSLISREARSAQEITIVPDESIEIDGVNYYQSGSNLLRDDEVLSSRVSNFEITPIEGTKKVKLKLESTNNDLNQNETYETTIYFRVATDGGEADD